MTALSTWLVYFKKILIKVFSWKVTGGWICETCEKVQQS